MSTTIHTTNGTFTGKNAETIIRRVFGRKAGFKSCYDMNSIEWNIVEKVPGESTYMVLGTMHDVDGELGRDIETIEGERAMQRWREL